MIPSPTPMPSNCYTRSQLLQASCNFANQRFHNRYVTFTKSHHLINDPIQCYHQCNPPPLYLPQPPPLTSSPHLLPPPPHAHTSSPPPPHAHTSSPCTISRIVLLITRRCSYSAYLHYYN